MACRGGRTCRSLQQFFITYVSLHAAVGSCCIIPCHQSCVQLLLLESHTHHHIIHLALLPLLQCPPAHASHPPSYWRVHIRAMQHYATHCTEHQRPTFSISFPALIVPPRGKDYAQVLHVQGRHSRITGDLDVPGVTRGGQHQPEGHHSQCQWPDAAAIPLPH